MHLIKERKESQDKTRNKLIILEKGTYDREKRQLATNEPVEFDK